MKVLHLVKTSEGAAWALRQTRELVKLGVEVHVALPPGGPLVAEYERAGVRVHLLDLDFPVRKPQQLPGFLGRFRRLVGDVKPDAIHSHFVGTTLTMRLALGRQHPVARIFQVPGPLHLEHRLFRAAELATAGPSDYWIGSCRWTVDRYLKSGVPRKRVFLSFYGSDIATFESRARGKLRRELGVSAEARIVGMVAFMYAPKWYLGRTRGIKGHEDLIDALALCIPEEPNLVGVFVGGAWNNAVSYEDRVRRYARKKCGERVVFLGTRDDVPELYPDMDVVVHPSRSENLGGAVESLLCGIPTIASNVGGLPDIVRHGESGWLVPAGDSVSLAGAILRVLRDPEGSRAVAENGRESIRRELDVRKTAKEVFEIYAEILGHSPLPWNH